AVYGMHIFYGGTVMIVNLQAPLVVTVVWLALRARNQTKPGSWAICGLVLGLSVLARQTTLLLAPLLVLWILFDFQPTQRLGRRLLSAATFVLPLAALILPFTLHNYRVGQDFVLVNSTGGYSFYMGNRQGTDGTWQLPPLDWPGRIDNPLVMREAFSSVAERELGRPLRPSEVSSYWLTRGLQEIGDDPFEWIKLELRKAGLFLNAYEVWNNRSFEISRQFSWVLRLPLISFGLIAPLALLGIALNLRRVAPLFPLFAGVAVYFFSALMIFVLSRYRFPGTVLMVPFAAFALVDLINRGLRSEWAGLATRFVALLLLSILVYWPLTSEKRLHMAWYNLGNRFRALERYEESVNAYQNSLQISPDSISTHNNLALALEGSGDRDQAIQSWSRVRQLAIMRANAKYIERADRHLSALHSAETNP
ncbi:tetratricopeptide repeat protein, partial [Myxococcota bacterium]|nr:tetratricopeptide repeat protein [Myxococcota bacterium]